MKKIKQIIAITCILIICSSGKIDKGFEALNIYDYFKAKKLFAKSLKKNTVAASFGLSVIYGRNDNPFHNLDSAFKYITLADTSYLKLEIKEIEKLKKLSLDSVLIANWKDTVDYKVFRKAKRINTIESYNKYLERHTNKALTPIATLNRDSIAFSKAKAINSSDSYLQYIETYPKSSYRKEAKNRYEERLFFQVVETRNTNSYKTFIKDYPNSPFNLQAQDSVFSLTTKTKTIHSYESFIQQNPNNRNVNKAWRIIYKLFTADFKPEKIVDFRLSYAEYPFLNELKTDLELATKEFYPTKQEGKWGFMDNTGSLMIDYEYDFVEPFFDGVALAVKDGLIGYINKSGNTVIPFKYSEGDSFNSGLAVVSINNHYGIINKTNDVILPFEYVEIGNLNSELILIANDTAYGYSNKQGEVKVQLVYKTAYDFNNGLAIVKRDSLFGAINQLGLEVIECQYQWLEPFDKYGRSKAKLNGLYGVIDVNGGVVVPLEYEAIGDFSDSLALLSKGGKYGYVDPYGEIRIPLKLDYRNDALLWAGFKMGNAKFYLNKRYGILNELGEKTFPAIFEDVGLYSDSNFVAVKKRGKWGYSNQNLRLMIPYQFKNAKSFQGDIGLVQLEKGWFLINSEEELINNIPYIEVERISNCCFKVKTISGWELVDSSAKRLIDSSYRLISFFNDETLQLINQQGVSYYNISKKSFFK